MADARPTSGQLAVLSVAVSVAGMLLGVWLMFGTTLNVLGWLLFILSFAGWLAAALLAMREGWHRGVFDR